MPWRARRPCWRAERRPIGPTGLRSRRESPEEVSLRAWLQPRKAERVTSSRADAFWYENSFIYQRRGNRGYSDPRFRSNAVEFRNEKKKGYGFAAVSGGDRVCGTGAEFPCISMDEHRRHAGPGSA